MKINESILMLFKSFGVSDVERAKIYIAMCERKEISPERVSRAVLKLIERAKFLPSLAELISEAMDIPESEKRSFLARYIDQSNDLASENMDDDVYTVEKTLRSTPALFFNRKNFKEDRLSIALDIYRDLRNGKIKLLKRPKKIDTGSQTTSAYNEFAEAVKRIFKK